MNATREQKAFAAALVLAAAALAFLVWLIYLAVPASPAPAWTDGLPAFDAACNAASAALALAGYRAIHQGRRDRHRARMLGALSFSALFLSGYVLYHRFHGETRFQGAAWLRPWYLALLASHVLLSALVLPLLLSVVALAGLGVFERHRRLARWTLPLWLYVSLSGVAVYVCLRSSY